MLIKLFKNIFSVLIVLLSNANALEMPQPNEEGRIHTLNQMGAMSTKEGKLEKQYLSDICPYDLVLDVGCAYGEMVIKAAEKGALAWANDLDERHLNILQNRLHKDILYKVFPKSGNFLNLNIPEGTYDKILMARILHFMKGEDVLLFLSKAYKLLVPGGKIYILVASPFIKLYESFIQEYEHRKEAGEEWPGYCSNVWSIHSSLRDCVPNTCHLFEMEHLRELVEKIGFKIVLAEYDTSPYHPPYFELNGRDYVSIIAQKPGTLI